MKHKLYYNSDKAANLTPQVNETMLIQTKDNYEKLINQKRQTQAVLIYANGTLFASLAEIDGVTVVTKDTLPDELTSMDQKRGLHYPVMMINQDYGTRGLNFRAASSP